MLPLLPNDILKIIFAYEESLRLYEREQFCKQRVRKFFMVKTMKLVFRCSPPHDELDQGFYLRLMKFIRATGCSLV